MPLPTIPSGNVASAIGGAYEVANSCMFNDGDAACMHKTPSSSGNRRTFTFSTWVKKTNILSTNIYNDLYSAYSDSNNISRILYWDSNILTLSNKVGGSFPTFMNLNTNHRDPSAWLHICIAVDTTQSVESNRVKFYVNGTQKTFFSSSTYPSQNEDFFFNHTVEHNVGQQGDDDSALYFDGYLAETVMIDGLQLAPTSFGEFDEDSPLIWKPIDVSGLTFGTNGFYLDYEDSSNLGNDKSGGTDFTEVNLAATDQATDTPTNNFATLNPIDDTLGYYTFSEGNCQVVSDSSGKAYTSSTLAVSKGKWYFETKMSSMVADERFLIGIAPRGAVENDHPDSTANGGINLSGFNAVIYSQGSSVLNNFFGNNTTRFDSWTGIIGMALDLTDGSEQITFSKDGAWVTGSGTTSTTFASALQVDISAKMDESTATGFWHLVVGEGNGSAAGTFQVNFGGCPAFTVSSGNADGNGYGNFEYPVPSGYYALCTKNLAEFG